MQPGDTVRFLDTPETRGFGIAGGHGYIERVNEVTVRAIFIDPLGGIDGPYTLPLAAVETRDGEHSDGTEAHRHHD